MDTVKVIFKQIWLTLRIALRTKIFLAYQTFLAVQYFSSYAHTLLVKNTVKFDRRAKTVL